MAVKKLKVDEAEKSFSLGMSYTEQAAQDPKDPTSRNLAMAMNKYASANARLLLELIDGVNDLLERVDRIEQMQKTPARAGAR